MMPGCFDLEMEGRHIVEEPGVHEVVRVCAGLGAVPDRALEETPDGLHGLQEGRYAEGVEGCRKRVPLSLNHSPTGPAGAANWTPIRSPRCTPRPLPRPGWSRHRRRCRRR